MRIEHELKLDFSDVLFRPKRSILASRNDVALEREYTFLHSKGTYSGIPIMAANMDTVGTFQVADVLHRKGLFTCISKHFTEQDWSKYAAPYAPGIAVSTGTSIADFEKLGRLMSKTMPYTLDFICIDVANGYSEHFVDYVKKVRATYPTKTIIAGNVVTADMTQELILSGADIVKVGIGGGCFTPHSLVETATGLRYIRSIKLGDMVLTHKGRFQPVTNIFIYKDKTALLRVNNIECTPNHEFYVIDNAHKDIVNNDNIHTWATWVAAEHLTSSHLLIKHKDVRMKYEFIEIESIDAFSYTGDVYDLEVGDDHSYNIDGIVVHNSVCTTRIKTGVGYPQLSAVIECADAAHGLGGHIISDGGCTCPGDVAKAFGAGADFVMLGGMFAGHDETGTVFHGMSSIEAMQLHNGGMQEYRASEGKEVVVPYKGPLDRTVNDILGGIRSTCTYVGAPTLKDLPKCTTFIRVTNQYNNVFGNSK